MSERPFMQLYVSDFIGDTLQLSTEQIGAYMLLLMAMWNAGGKLPSDEAKLARVARMSVKKWKAIADDLMPFFEVDSDIIRHNRLTKELQKSESKSQSRASAGAEGGRAKALKDKEARVANAMPEPQHLPDTIKKDKSSSLRSEDSAGASAKPKSDVEEFKAVLLPLLDAERLDAICKVRRKKGATFSAHAGKLLVGALTACPNVVAAADEMILRNWTSVKPEWLSGRQSQAQAPPARSPSITDVLKQQVLEMQADGRENPESDGNGKTNGAGQALLGLAYSSR
ncbi:YdaU family protein [Rhizobium rhizogenes]|uniref:YdaU family protein n=1 Tax=Rhizobium rhizogenes TaxID=359 RepID=UPI001F275E76|nr:DUF1376 domain-containing protein [Rhizobium rhizogenes]